MKREQRRNVDKEELRGGDCKNSSMREMKRESFCCCVWNEGCEVGRASVFEFREVA